MQRQLCSYFMPPYYICQKNQFIILNKHDIFFVILAFYGTPSCGDNFQPTHLNATKQNA